MEASAKKPGNVTPTKGFDGLSYEDFVKAAERIGQFIEKAAQDAEKAEIGKLVYGATSGKNNVNFGIVMMFVPLAACHGGSTAMLLKSLTPEDTKWIVKAMQKGKLGHMELGDKKLAKYDVLSKGIFKTIENEKMTPLKLMAMARPYDTLAGEWVKDYPISRAIARRIGEDNESIVTEYLRVLAECPDTLIARKVGLDRSKEVSQMARWVLSGNLSREEFDSYLRSEGNSLNPGTTADLMAAGLFLKLIKTR
jgi:triphosphoribosyl-dephospho-CoA synthase